MNGSSGTLSRSSAGFPLDLVDDLGSFVVGREDEQELRLLFRFRSLAFGRTFYGSIAKPFS